MGKCAVLCVLILVAGCGSAELARQAVTTGADVRNGLLADSADALRVACEVARLQTTDAHYARAEASLREAASDGQVELSEALAALATLKEAELKSAALRARFASQREVLLRRGERLNGLDLIVLQQLTGGQGTAEKLIEMATKEDRTDTTDGTGVTDPKPGEEKP